MNWIERYNLCLRLASKYSYPYRYDIVHYTWLRRYENRGDDLFALELQEEVTYYAVAIKFGWYGWNYRYYKESVFGVKYENDFSQFANPETFTDNIESQDFVAHFVRFLSTLEKEPRAALDQVFKMKIEGYSQQEIADLLGVSPQRINKQVKKLKKYMKNNPFNGSRTEIHKIITETQWENRGDKEDFEIDDENEYYRLLLHKESKEGWLVRLKTQKKNPYLEK